MSENDRILLFWILGLYYTVLILIFFFIFCSIYSRGASPEEMIPLRVVVNQNVTPENPDQNPRNLQSESRITRLINRWI